VPGDGKTVEKENPFNPAVNQFVSPLFGQIGYRFCFSVPKQTSMGLIDGSGVLVPQ
jgi:hypothetical protein